MARIKLAQISIHLLCARVPFIQTANHYYWNLQPLCLVNSHNLNIPLRKWLFYILILVDAFVFEQTQKNIKEIIPYLLQCSGSNTCIAVKVLKGTQYIGEDNKIADLPLIFYKCCEWFDSEKTIEVICQTSTGVLVL